MSMCHFHVPLVDSLLHTVFGIISTIKVDNCFILIVTTWQMQPWRKYSLENNVPNGSKWMHITFEDLQGGDGNNTNMSILVDSNLCEVWYDIYLLLEKNKYFSTFNCPGNSHNYLSIFSFNFLREQLESERHEIGVQYVRTWSPIIRIEFMVAMYRNNI